MFYKIQNMDFHERVNPLTAFALILLFSIVLTTGGQYLYIFALIISISILFLMSYKRAASSICIIIIIFVIINLLKPYLGNLIIGSIYTMLLIILKFLPVFILGRVVSSYNSSYIIAAFRKVGLNNNVGIGITLFFRFIPEIKVRLREINMGMKIRGFKPSIIRPVKTFELYFVPLMYKCIDISDTLTCSIISKGIEYDCKKTSYHKIKFGYIDAVLLIIGLISVGVSIWTGL